jgi:periplasmic protein TonB
VFTRLVASAATGSPFRRPAVIAGSIAAHVVLLAGVIWASAPATAETTLAVSDLEEVTYIDIAEAPPPEDMVFEEPPADFEPPPAAAPPVAAAPAPRPAAAPRPTQPAQPRTPPAVAAVAEPAPAGFQELRTPPAVIGIAPPDASAAAVRAEDFGGRGQVGGTAGGTRTDSAGGGRIGTGAAGTAGGTGTGAGGAGDGPPTGTFSANLVDRRAALSNQSHVVRVLERLYPPGLKASGIEGSVQVQFVVSAEGRVDMSTVQVLSATDPQFTDATVQALKDFRFTPARKGNHNVRMLTMVPIEWKIRRQ